MSSIFARALGDDFALLHPMLQRRFGVGLDSGYAAVGTGVMTRIRRGPWWTVPFLWIGWFRNILIPRVGENVPCSATTSSGCTPDCGSSSANRAR